MSKSQRISKSEVVKLAKLMCTVEEIASFFEVDRTTISRKFAPEIAKGRELGKISLRRKQYNVAVQKGNVTMLIWLGKQYLEQAEPEKKTIEEIPEIPDFENMSNDDLVKFIEARKN